MKKIAIVFAVGVAALFAGSTANATSNGMKSKPSTDAVQSRIATQSSTDISARHRHGHWRHQHWGHRHHRPYYNSYGYYAPRSYGYYGPRHYGPRYYGGGPGVTLRFGGGGWY